MLLNDREITNECIRRSMISPFIPVKTSEIDGVKVPSFGLSHAGYDIRLNPDDFRIFLSTTELEEIKIGEDYSSCIIKTRASLREINGTKQLTVKIPGNSYALGVSLENFVIPHNIVGRCLGKSTFARVGIIVNVTPLEPGWCGHLTLEISNSCPIPVVIPVLGGIAQIQFERINTPSSIYHGKYQSQGSSVTLGKL